MQTKQIDTHKGLRFSKNFFFKPRVSFNRPICVDPFDFYKQDPYIYIGGFSRRCAMASLRVPEQKVILCGEYGAGKSSIFRRFTNNSFVMTTNRASTLGLDHSDKLYRVDDKELKVETRLDMVSCWCFIYIYGKNKCAEWELVFDWFAVIYN